MRCFCQPDMASSWFFRQGALYAFFHDGFWKSNRDFLIAFHSNFLSAMHGFRDNEVLLQAGYKVIVIYAQGALHAVHWRILLFFREWRSSLQKIRTVRNYWNISDVWVATREVLIKIKNYQSSIILSNCDSIVNHVHPNPSPWTYWLERSGFMLTVFGHDGQKKLLAYRRPPYVEYREPV